MTKRQPPDSAVYVLCEVGCEGDHVATQSLCGPAVEGITLSSINCYWNWMHLVSLSHLGVWKVQGDVGGNREVGILVSIVEKQPVVVLLLLKACPHPSWGQHSALEPRHQTCMLYICGWVSVQYSVSAGSSIVYHEVVYILPIVRFAQARKCSNEGRALMQLDFQQFRTKLEKLSGFRSYSKSTPTSYHTMTALFPWLQAPPPSQLCGGLH